jgi:hypothetical protein
VQLADEVEPITLLKVPATHDAHELCPVELWYLLRIQFSMVKRLALAPGVRWYRNIIPKLLTFRPHKRCNPTMPFLLCWGCKCQRGMPCKRSGPTRHCTCTEQKRYCNSAVSSQEMGHKNLLSSGTRQAKRVLRSRAVLPELARPAEVPPRRSGVPSSPARNTGSLPNHTCVPGVGGKRTKC